jgi:hypothetical protein
MRFVYPPESIIFFPGMKSPVPVDCLEIVGYANVLLDTMLPSVVPPVFRRKGGADEAFVPPYLSYNPQMALIESIFVRDYPEEYLAQEYFVLSDRIMDQVSDSPAQLVERSHMLRRDKKAYADAIRCMVRVAPHDPQLAIPLMAGLSIIEPSNDEEFWAERQLNVLLSQDTRTMDFALCKWGSALRNQSRAKSGEILQQLRRVAREKLLTAENIRAGSGAYTLACLEALDGNVTEAIKWLKVVAGVGPLSREKLIKDTDFDPIRKAPAFSEFLQSLPES